MMTYATLAMFIIQSLNILKADRSSSPWWWRHCAPVKRMHTSTRLQAQNPRRLSSTKLKVSCVLSKLNVFGPFILAARTATGTAHPDRAIPHAHTGRRRSDGMLFQQGRALPHFRKELVGAGCHLATSFAWSHSPWMFRLGIHQVRCVRAITGYHSARTWWEDKRCRSYIHTWLA
jgi:hypothetical protein